MSHHNELDSYIARVQQRLRLGTWLQGAAVFAGTALVVTVALVLVLNRFAFPEFGVTGGRSGDRCRACCRRSFWHRIAVDATDACAHCAPRGSCDSRA